MKVIRLLAVGAILSASSVSLADQETPVAAARFGISIDGYSVSAASFQGGGELAATPKASSVPLKIVVDRTGSEPIWEWLATSINQGAAPKKIVGQPSGKRRATFTGAVITEIKFDDLDANRKNEPMKVTLTVVPKQIAPAKGVSSSKSAPAHKAWSPSSFALRVDGKTLHKVSKIDSITIKQGVVGDGQAPAMVLERARITLGAKEAKKLAGALAKDASTKLSIVLTNDDGSTWKTLTVSGLTVQSTKFSGASGDVTIKGKKILMN